MNDPIKHSKPRIASMNDSTIAAAVDGLFRFASEALAVEKLAWISKHFIRAKEQDAPQDRNAPALRLWVQGFAVTPSEKEQGYRGHYARLTIAAIDNERFSIKAEKLPVELARHPQKDRPKMKHADSGHPVMRAAEHGKAYSSVTAAREALIKLHEEFSGTTTPGQDKLYVRLYNRKLMVEGSENKQPPIEKIVLKIKSLADGTAQLFIKKLPPRKTPEAKVESDEPQGKFAAMVKLRKPRKNPQSDSKK